MSNQNENMPPRQAVRFSSNNQEIEPQAALQHLESLTAPQRGERENLSPEAREELRNLSRTLQQSRLQSSRMENFSFEPVSLPVSRVASSASSPKTPARSGAPSPKPSPIHSPLLTPAASGSHEEKQNRSGSAGQAYLNPATITPQESPPHEAPPTSMEASQGERKRSGGTQGRLPMSSQAQGRPKSMADVSGAIPSHPKHVPQFTVGPSGDSQPPSREGSPSGTPGTTTPGANTPYSRPFMPAEDRDNPYARGKRAPASRNLDAIDARFIFSGRDARRQPNHSSSPQLPRSTGSSGDLKVYEDKRHSIFGGHSHRKHDHHNDSSSNLPGKSHGSMSELKRFFRLGGHKRKDKDKRAQSPAGSIKAKADKSGTRTPPSGTSSIAVPFADDHGLESRYGKFGRMLGSGAGGSVRLMKRSSDGVTFAVKQFRARHSYESEREYNKKVTAEFCIGSTLHHGNIIETMDIIHEKGNWYEVMEYAPYDLFAIVMTGKMTREEITCCTLQVLSGVTYLHSMGLAHRDLKLDNVVVNEYGIMKIIDFGSAVIFRYPFENEIVLASGIVGSDPYLAPEVYDLPKYDPQPADIWSLAIIFCCMTLRRFPWKAPRLSDNSYKLFVSEPENGPGPSGAYSEPASRMPSERSEGHHHHHHHNGQKEAQSEPASRTDEAPRPSTASSTTTTTTTTTGEKQQQQQQQVIKGPWRLLRLLPRETRHIIGRMLEIDPRKRATLDEILADRWVATSPVCRQEQGGAVVRAEGHEHTLQPAAETVSAPASKK